MTSANISGSVMGKMIGAQSIVVASTATRRFNHESGILPHVFFHCLGFPCQFLGDIASVCVPFHLDGGSLKLGGNRLAVCGCHVSSLPTLCRPS
jgi:hypothetical protein